MALHTRMLIGGLLGATSGIAAHWFWAGDSWLETFITYVTRPAGQIFLRLLFMLVVPLIFSALVLGVAGLGDLRRLGRIGLKTLAYTVLVSSIAVLLGLVLVNTLRPGDGVSEEARARLTEGAAGRAAALGAAAAPKTGLDLLVQIVPDNPIKAAANGDMLAVMFFSLMFGIGSP
jgi:DAACS family dicarboxylate/amino acid:cation (Na+ or H+) symporter